MKFSTQRTAPRVAALGQRARVGIAGLALLSAGFVACSDSGPQRPKGAERGPPQEKVVGPEGGVVEFDTGWLEIPAGALSSTVSVVARPVGDLAAVEFEPAGLRFVLPAELHLMPAGDEPDHEVIVKILNIEGMDPSSTELTEPFPTENQDGYLSARIRGFSRYASRIVRGPRPSSGATAERAMARGRLIRSDWDPCRRAVTLAWTGFEPVFVQRILSRPGLAQPLLRTFVLPGAPSTGPSVYEDQSFPRPARNQLAWTVTYELYRLDRPWIYLVGGARIPLPELVAPDPITNLLVVRRAPDEMRVSWDAPPSPHSGFEIRRSVPFSSPIEVVTNRYRDNSVVPMTSYTYSIRPFLDPTACNRRLYGPTISATGPAFISGQFLRVSGLTSSVQGLDVSLSWQPTPDAVSYRIRRTDPSGARIDLGQITTTAFSDQVVSAGRYTYEVTPIGTNGNSGLPATIQINILDCSRSGQLAIHARYQGQTVPTLEFMHLLETGGDPQPVVELTLTGTISGSATYLWQEEDDSGVRTELGRGPSLAYPVPCRARSNRTNCLVRVQVGDECGLREAATVIEVRS